jgi:hypothetical protein
VLAAAQPGRELVVDPPAGPVSAAQIFLGTADPSSWRPQPAIRNSVPRASTSRSAAADTYGFSGLPAAARGAVSSQ